MKQLTPGDRLPQLVGRWIDGSMDHRQPSLMILPRRPRFYFFIEVTGDHTAGGS